MTLLRILLFFLREAAVNLRRSWKVSLLAVVTIAMSLFFGGLFLLLSSNLARLVGEWRQQARVVVYLSPEFDFEAAPSAAAEISARAPWVRRVDRVSAEEARGRFGAIFPSLADLTEGWSGEPLPASLEVTYDPDQAGGAAFQAWLAELRAAPEVDLVDDDRDWLDQLETLVAVFRAIGLTLGILLLAAAIFTIASVVRLTAFLYRDEIAVMRLVGATEFYIRGPFYTEGLIQGLGGGGLAVIGLYVAFRMIKPQSEAALLGTVLIGDFLSPAELAAVLLLGGGAGLLGAILSLRRELAGDET